MPDSPRPLYQIADDVARNAIAQVGWWPALRWAAGLLSQVRSRGDVRDVALILAMVVLA